jgi:hypothetical protein
MDRIVELRTVAASRNGEKIEEERSKETRERSLGENRGGKVASSFAM